MVIEAVGPTFLLVAVGYVLGRFGKIPTDPFVKLSFWLLSPALIFETLRTSQLPAGEAGLVALFVLVHYGLMFLASLVAGRVLFPGDLGGQRVASLLLTFGNCGNLGLPILYFAYGRRAMDVGVIFLATNTVLLATLGVGITSWQGKGRWRDFGKNILGAPWLYAVGLGALMRVTQAWPGILAQATQLLFQAAIPVFLLLLGLELAAVDFKALARPALILAVARLILGAALAWPLAFLFTGDRLIRASLIIEGSVPSAVNAYILAAQYRHKPDLAAASLLLSTAFSLGTLSLTLFLLSRFG